MKSIVVIGAGITGLATASLLLRYLGYCFNPVSFFSCFDRAEQLRVILAEVSNTLGGTHNYWLRPDPASRTFRSTASKSLYTAGRTDSVMER